MDNTIIVLAANIQKSRKNLGLTQEDLANSLGVTFQAVSKWENAKAAADITLLPALAELFGCYIDELFGKRVKTELHFDLCTELPFPDDTVIREVLCNGRKIIDIKPIG